LRHVSVHWTILRPIYQNTVLVHSASAHNMGSHTVDMRTCTWRFKSHFHSTLSAKVTRITVVRFRRKDFSSYRNKICSVQTVSETHYASCSWGKVLIFSRKLTSNIHMVPISSIHGTIPPFSHTSSWVGDQYSIETNFKF